MAKVARADIAHFMRRLARGSAERVTSAAASARILAAAVPERFRGGAGQPEIILHAGGHRTGTTSIQAFILQERRTLAAQGVNVLRTGQGSNGAHHRLIQAFDGQPYGRLKMHLLEAELRQAFPRKVLLSSELAKNAVVHGRGHRLIDGLRAAGAGRVQMLLYLRSPFALANAAYAELTASLELGGEAFGDFAIRHDAGPAYRYDFFLDLAARDDVSLVVRPYSEAVRRSIVSDFEAALGVRIGAPAEPRYNSSLGPVGLEAMRLMAPWCGQMGVPARSRLAVRLRGIAGSLGEAGFWGIDPSHETLLPTADRRTEEFAQGLWAMSWREAIGEERRPLNLFDPSDAGQQALLQSTLWRMRQTAFGSGGTPHKARRSLITRST
jgi:hypothetical protein